MIQQNSKITNSSPFVSKESNSAIEIGKRIKVYRRLANLSQAELGNALDVTSQQIHKYENGSNEISFKKLCLIANTLNIPVGLLINDQTQTSNPMENETLKDEKSVRFLLEISKYIDEMNEDTKKKVLEFVKMMRN